MRRISTQHTPTDSNTIRLRAEAALRHRRWSEAVIACRRLLEVYPTFADGWFNLGYALRHEGEYSAALEAYAEALRQGIKDQAIVHVNCAAILSDHIRDDVAAEAALRRALEVHPAHAPALLNLGNLYEEQGRRDAAVATYRRLITSLDKGDPAVGQALSRLAHLVPPESADDPVLRQLQSAAVRSDGTLAPSLRATMWFALGRAHDVLGATDAAFDAFEVGKRIAHAGHAIYDPDAAEKHSQNLISAFRTPVRRQAPRYSPEPVFICGMFRSGSTLIEQVLAAHPMVCTAGELDLLPRMAAQTLTPFPASVASLGPGRCEALAMQYHAALLSRLQKDDVGHLLATDKRPDNFLLIGLIKHLFPGAKIVHTVRDPRDVALSVFMQHLNPRAFPYAGTLAGIGHQIGEHHRLMAHWAALYPDDIIAFDYDAFVAEPEATLRPLLSSLGLPWDPACLQFHRVANTVKTASYWQVRKPLYADASGRWRRYRAHLEPLDRALRAAGI